MTKLNLKKPEEMNAQKRPEIAYDWGEMSKTIQWTWWERAIRKLHRLIGL